MKFASSPLSLAVFVRYWLWLKKYRTLGIFREATSGLFPGPRHAWFDSEYSSNGSPWNLVGRIFHIFYVKMDFGS